MDLESDVNTVLCTLRDVGSTYLMGGGVTKINPLGTKNCCHSLVLLLVCVVGTTLTKVYTVGTGKVAQQLRMLTALREDQDLVPSTDVAAHNQL